MTADELLNDEASAFADKLTSLTQGVLGADTPAFRAVVAGNKVQVAPLDAEDRNQQIPVCINGQQRLNLYVRYFCLWDGPGRYLAVDDAVVHVFYADSSDPLIRYEYVRSCQDPPGAHLQVHAHRDEIAYLLRLAERGQSRPAKKMRQNSVPRLSEMHFPVGGHRFRPSLEDVLLLLQREFGIDTEPGWRGVVQEHLERWRLIQLRASVRDAHEDAAATLRELGYVVTAPEGLTPQSPGRLFWP